MSRIRVLIADDHTLVREGLRALLEGRAGIEVIAEASNGREAIDRAVQLRPDVVLMDLAMPEVDGLAATRRLAKLNPAIRTLILTVHDTEDYFFRVLEAGAHGFLVKDAAASDLVAAVRAVHHGGVFLHPPMAKRLVEEYLQRIGSGEDRAAHALLSPREQQVLALIGHGHTNQEIADQLAISVNTVQAHRSHIIDKLDLHSRADLMRYAVRVGLMRGPG